MLSFSTASRFPSLVGLACCVVVPSGGCEGETGFSKAPDPPLIEEGQGEISVEPAEVRIEDIDWENGLPKGQVVRIANALPGRIFYLVKALLAEEHRPCEAPFLCSLIISGEEEASPRRGAIVEHRLLKLTSVRRSERSIQIRE